MHETSIWKIASLILIGAIAGYIVGRFELNTVNFSLSEITSEHTDNITETSRINEQDSQTEVNEQEVTEINLEGRPFLGNSEAGITIVVFGDYESPFSNTFYREIMENLRKDYIDTGKIRYYYKDYPLEINKKAFRSSLATYCANDQGKYWDMHNALNNNFEQIIASQDIDITLGSIATDIGLNKGIFLECLTQGIHKDVINKDIAEAEKAGVANTPRVFINNIMIKDTPTNYQDLIGDIENTLN